MGPYCVNYLHLCGTRNRAPQRKLRKANNNKNDNNVKLKRGRQEEKVQMVSKLKKAACRYGIRLHHPTDDCEKRVKGERYLAFLGPVAMTCCVKNVNFFLFSV